MPQESKVHWVFLEECVTQRDDHLINYKVFHLKPNGAHGVSPLPRPCWIPQYRLPLCARKSFSCVNVILNGNHQARVRTEYIQTFPGEVPPSRFTIYEILKKLETTGYVPNKKRNRKRAVLTEETLDEIGASPERTPTKSIQKLAQQVGISEFSAHRATKLLKLKPYKCTVSIL